MPPATAGWQQQAGKPQPQIAIHRPVSRLFFSLSLPLIRKQPNYTWMLKNLLKLYCIWTWDTLWVCVCVCVCVCMCSFVLLYVSPLMRKLQNNIWGTISRIGGWGTNRKIIKTEISLHLNLEGFFNYYFLFCFILVFYTYFFYHLLIFYFYSYLYSFYFLFSILSLSNAFSA
jgi:hypothetical protein